MIVHLSQLHQAITAAGVPIVGIDADGRVSPEHLQAAAQVIIDMFDDTEAAETIKRNLRDRSQAQAFIESSHDASGKARRVTISILLDELNILRKWVRDFKTQVAAATTLADLKTRVASLPNLPDRTMTQAKAAFAARVDEGSED